MYGDELDEKEKVIVVNDHFEDYVTDWNYRIYLSVGAYGSSKSHSAAQKIIIKCLEERRKVLVIRQTYESIKESCFDLIKEQLDSIDMLEKNNKAVSSNKVLYRENGMQFKFPNGSRIIFKGLDKVDNMKSINGVSIVWVEECTQISLASFNEILLRIRTQQSVHFILTCNPVDMENWVYRRFFKRLDEDTQEEITILDDELLYKHRSLCYNDVYYHHSTCEDNPYLTQDYIKRLDEMKQYDPDLWRIARLGKFGVNGKIVLPQFTVARDARQFTYAVSQLPRRLHYIGFDFGFEESFNAVIRMAVDEENSILYIYDELYENGVTDDVFITRPMLQKIKEEQNYCKRNGIAYNPIVADSASPKDIKYYSKQGLDIRKCDNRGMAKGGKGTRIQNTKKIKRFKQIVCSPMCKNTIRELKSLVYAEDRNKKLIYDQFNIDPHSFSAIWYGLDKFEFKDLKAYEVNNSWVA